MLLSVRGLTKSYRTSGEQLAVLRGVDLALERGETVALTGESGSGKSTLLHLIAGLDGADGGEIVLDGTAIGTLPDSARAALRRDRLGLVFQQFNLIPSLPVGDNLAFQARIADRYDAAWQDELIGRLGLGRLPGDVVIELGSLKIYLPIATSLLLSVALSAVLWLAGRS